jgi:hypothetical protein
VGELGLSRWLRELFLAVVYGRRCVGEAALGLSWRRDLVSTSSLTFRKPRRLLEGHGGALWRGVIKFVPLWRWPLE